MTAGASINEMQIVLPARERCLANTVESENIKEKDIQNGKVFSLIGISGVILKIVEINY